MNCPDCNFENHSQATYCSNCGIKIKRDKEGDYKIPLRNILVFFFILTAYILVLNFSDFEGDYELLLIQDGIFALIVSFFFFRNFNKNKRWFKSGKKQRGITANIVFGMLIFSLFVYHLADFLNQNVFDRNAIVYYWSFINSPSPVFFCILSIAVFPAIFEEIAFRGILFDESMKLMGLKPTIILTSLLFTFLHFSIVSALWLLPIGLLFGYLRARYNTIVYGMLGHFLYNTGIVLLEIMYA